MGKILGRGVEWKCFGTKLAILRDFINNSTEDIILYTDARDVVYFSDDKPILEEFLKMDCKILFGADTNLFPNKELVHGDPSKKYRYLNSGLFIGYTKHLRELFNSIELVDGMDDQEALQKKYIEGAPITLDTECRIFQNLWDENGGRTCNFDMYYHITYIKNLLTGTRPKIFHAPGPTTVLSQAYKVAMGLY
jgi:hypothetical protein